MPQCGARQEACPNCLVTTLMARLEQTRCQPLVRTIRFRSHGGFCRRKIIEENKILRMRMNLRIVSIGLGRANAARKKICALKEWGLVCSSSDMCTNVSKSRSSKIDFTQYVLRMQWILNLNLLHNCFSRACQEKKIGEFQCRW